MDGPTDEPNHAIGGLVEGTAVRRAHLDRLSNETGAEGERNLIATIDELVPRPKGAALRVLLSELERTGVSS